LGNSTFSDPEPRYTYPFEKSELADVVCRISDVSDAALLGSAHGPSTLVATSFAVIIGYRPIDLSRTRPIIARLRSQFHPRRRRASIVVSDA